MTVTYTNEVTTSSTGFGCFLKLLARWKGSIYKIVWLDLVLFLAIYYLLNVLYVFGLNDDQKGTFRTIVDYCSRYSSLIPLSFVLGFYVNIVYTRWWSQYTSIPFPDNLAILIGASIKGQDERARIVRRTIVRYVCVTFTITLTMMSPKVKKRFPTLNHLVDSGLITNEEKKIMEELDAEYPSYSKYWLPLAWAANITTRAKHEGIIRSEMAVETILNEINLFRTKCGSMLDYDWISVPLVYTQVVTLAVYSYFLVTVIGNQLTEDEFVGNFPVMPVLEFFFYMGWLKVAETLINPFGDDDDDFEVMWMVDRHIQVCYLLVDKIHQDHPKLGKDYYWEQTAPNWLPYTVASQQYMQEYPVESTQGVKVKKQEQDLIIPEETTKDDDDGRTNKRTGSALWNVVNGIMLRRRNNRTPRYALRRVHVGNHTDSFDEAVNTYENEGPNKITIPLVTKPEESELPEEFQRLRDERLQKQKEKVLKYMDLLKLNKDRHEQEKIVEEILTYSDKIA